MIFTIFQKNGFLGILGPPSYGIGYTIRIGPEMLCLPYAGLKEKKKSRLFFVFFDFLKNVWTFCILLKLLRLLLETKIAYSLPKKSIIIWVFLPKGQKKNSDEGRSPPQELKVGPCSGPFLLVYLNLVLKKTLILG